MAVWAKAFSLTASCLSPLCGFASLPGCARKLPEIWGMAVISDGYSCFLHHNFNWLVMTRQQHGRKSDKNRNSNIQHGGLG